MNTKADIILEDLSEPLTFPVDAYVSREYAEAEGGNGACPGPMAGSVKSSPRLNTVTPLREMGNMHSQHVVARLFANTLVPVVHTASAEPDGHRVATPIRTQLRQTSSSICCIRLFEGLFMNRHLLHPQMPT